MSSFSSPTHVHESVSLSPLPQAHGSNPLAAAGALASLVPDQLQTSRAAVPSKNNTIFPNNSCFDDKIMQRHSSSDPLLLSVPTAQAASFIRDIKRTSVVWDQEAGRYVSVPVSAAEARKRPSLPNAATSNEDKRPALPSREPQPPPALPKPGVQQSENLTYTGESIFFGGPLLSAPMRDSLRGEGGPSSRNELDRVPMNLGQDSIFKRNAISNQLPIFIPGDFELNPPPGSSLK